MAELEPDESTSLGPLMTLTARVLDRVLQPVKVYYSIYAEEVRHIHVHVFPRMSNMPSGNIPNIWIGQWMDFLHRLGLKKSYSDGVVAHYAETLHRAYLDIAG